MSDPAQLLQALRPMREPPLPSPVSPYLTAMMIGGLAAIGAALVYAVLRRRFASRRAALKALSASHLLDRADRLAAQAQLLREIVRERNGAAGAQLHGTAWLATLDRAFATTFFTQGAGTVFGEALYRRVGQNSAVEHDTDTLEPALRRLIGRPHIWRRDRRVLRRGDRA